MLAYFLIMHFQSPMTASEKIIGCCFEKIFSIASPPPTYIQIPFAHTVIYIGGICIRAQHAHIKVINNFSHSLGYTHEASR